MLTKPCTLNSWLAFLFVPKRRQRSSHLSCDSAIDNLLHVIYTEEDSWVHYTVH